MSSSIVAVAVADGDHLGEGPVWLPRERVLTRVDITTGTVHSWDWAAGTSTSLRLVPPVSFAIPRANGGLVVGHGRSVVTISPDQRCKTIASVEPAAHGNRFNDAKCDAAGRLWAGTMSTTRAPGAAGLYRIDPDGACEQVVGGTTISNGLGWTDDGERMYFVDSTTQRIDAFDVDGARGRISGRRPLVQIPARLGLPDGLAVDAEGGVWVALFGGGALHRYDDRGELTAVVPLPVTNPTCPVFGGPDGDVLLVTSARHRLTLEQAIREPLAGAVLSVQTSARGAAVHAFAG